jgi:RimJ/RimL family protein N-acetyltransferase
MRLETARLVIRTFEAQDAEPWLAMVNDPEVRRFLPPGPIRTKETFQGAIERRQLLERERGYAMWAVDVKATGAFIGQCGFQPVEGTEPEVELAYHFNMASWGSGYATEAAMAVLAYGLGPVGLDRVIALVVPENIGSWRVLEKIGMRYEVVAEYHDMLGLKKYTAERDSWRPPDARYAWTPNSSET